MPRRIPLPRAWNRRAKSAIIHILALSHYAFTAMLALSTTIRRRSWGSSFLGPVQPFSQASAASLLPRVRG